MSGEPIEWLARWTLTLAGGTPVANMPRPAGLVCLSSVHLPAERMSGVTPPAAVYVGLFARPCGHGSNGPVPQWVELCVECAAVTRARPVAQRETACAVCAVESPVALVAVRDVPADPPVEVCR